MKNVHDDEGLIDLRALSVPPRHGASATSAAFSFATEPPPGGPAPDATATATWGAHRKTIGLGAAAVAFVVLGCIGLAFAFRGEQAVTPPIRITSTLVATPAPAAAPAPAPVASPVASAAASSDDDDDSSSDTAKPKKPKARKGKGHAGHTGSAPAAVKRPKASDPCHCRGDFQCNIRCAANFKH